MIFYVHFTYNDCRVYSHIYYKNNAIYHETSITILCKNSAFRSLAVWRKLWKLMTTLAVQWVDWLLMLVHLLSMHELKLRYYHLYIMLYVVGFVNDWYSYWSILVYCSQNHRFSYGEPMTVESTTQALCDLALRFGEGDEESMVRPKTCELIS